MSVLSIRTQFWYLWMVFLFGCSYKSKKPLKKEAMIFSVIAKRVGEKQHLIYVLCKIYILASVQAVLLGQVI